MAKTKKKTQKEWSPDNLVLTRNEPKDIWELLNYADKHKWVLNKGLTLELSRSLKRQSKNQIKIQTAGKNIYAVGIKNEDLDYMTEIANKPMFKISTGKEIHILGLADLGSFEPHMKAYKKECAKVKKSDLDSYAKHIKIKKEIYPKYIDKMVTVIQKDINHNKNKLNVSVGDVIKFNYSGKIGYRNIDMLHLIEDTGDSQGAGKVVKVTKTGVSIREVKALTDSGDYDRNTVGFRIKNKSRHISFKRILEKCKSNYIPEKTFFGWEDIKNVWSYNDLSS